MRVIIVLLVGAAIVALPTLDSANTDRGRRRAGILRQPSRYQPLTGSLLRSKPIDPSRGRGRHSRRRPLLAARRKIKDAISEARINEMTKIFKANVERLWTFRQLDLIFVIDGSSTVGLANFLDEIKFVSRFVSGIEVDMNHTRVAVLTFADNVTSWVNQVSEGEHHAHKCSLLGQDLPNIVYTGGGTFTKGALTEADFMLENARRTSHKVIFLITDGDSNGGDPLQVAASLKRKRVEIFTFGIRDGNKDELTAIASTPKSQHRIILNSFKEFELVARRAMHSDVGSGHFIVEHSSHCDKYCTESNCCHGTADCRCGTTTGQYECVCKKGFYGPGLKQQGCEPCPEGTYKNEALPGDKSSCTSCPDLKMTSPAASTSLDQCVCAEGFKKEHHRCEPLMCEDIFPPANSSFLECDVKYRSTCTVGCDAGFDLQGTSTIICGKHEVWTALDGSEKEEAFCQVRYCEPLAAPEHGTIMCSNDDNSYSTECTLACDEGFRIHGSSFRTCEANRRWTGGDTECTVITCPSLPHINHVNRTGDCVAESNDRPTYGDQCSFSCPLQGFTLLIAPTLICSDSGQWQPTILDESAKICNDTRSPEIACPPNLTVYTKSRKPFAYVTWKPPVATDNSESVTVTPSWTFPASLHIGEHHMTYTATDQSGLSTQCQFTVTVEDDEPPMIQRCSGPQPVIIERGEIEAENVEWTLPTFTDNSGSLTVTGNATFGTFPVGVTVIEYVARDEAGNTRSCMIDVIVQDNTCKPSLVKPRNGHIDCRMVFEVTHCEYICDSSWFGFAMAQYGNPLYKCSQNAKLWKPKVSNIYDCSRQKFSSQVLKDFQMTYDMGSLATCNDTTFIDTVQRTFFDILSVEIPRLCAGKVDGHLTCTLVELTVKCIGKKQEVEEEEEEMGYGDSYGYDYYGGYSMGEEEEDAGRRKRSVRQNGEHGRKRKQRVSRRFKRDTEYGETVPNYEEYDDDYDDYEDTPSDTGGGSDVMEEIPDDILRDADLNPRDTDVDVNINGGESVPPEVAREIANLVPDVIPGHVLERAEPDDVIVKEMLEISMTIRGEVVLDGVSHSSDRSRHSRMVEYIRNLDLESKFEEGGDFNEIQPDTIVHSELLTYSPNTYAHTKDELICPIGTVMRDKAYCVNCPVGTYYDVITATCVSCPSGTFQDFEAQLSCKPCPLGTATEDNHGRGLEECKNLCEPGFYSDKGVEMCSACPQGTFVDFEGATGCASCPPGNGTVGVASNSLKDCGELCPPGFVSATGFVPCRRCPEGNFQDQPGKTFCYTCSDAVEEDDGIFVACADVAPEEFPGLAALYYNECFAEPCQNNATCEAHGTTFSCICQPGFTGELCETEIDECLTYPCAVTGTCVDMLNGFRCECAPGFAGELCAEEMNECESLPCQNGAACVDLVNAISCDCTAGFEGDLCDIDIHECASNPCANDGNCVDDVAGFHCDCVAGYEGMMCQTDVNDCVPEPCFNGASCADGINEFRCDCKPGFAGSMCEENINECSSDPCVNGECLDLIDSYKCLCPPTYLGDHCEEVGDPNFDLVFDKPNTYHHVKIEYALPNMTEVTVSFYLTCNSSDTYGTPFSYAVGDGKDADTLTLTDLSALTLYVNGEFAVSDTRSICDGKTYLITVVWKSEGGNWFIYLDGKLEDNGNGLAAGQSIPGGGVLVIGQEQDRLGGGFSASQEFLGTISQFNIYDYAFTPQEVFLLFWNCANNVGNVRAWAEMGEGIIGRLKKISTSFCLPCPTINSDEGTDVQIVNEYQIDVSCRVGHELVFNTARPSTVYSFRCGNDATWKFRGQTVEPEHIKCEKVSCLALSEIDLGSVTVEGTKYGDNATYSCTEGYQVVGEAETTCQADQTWSNSPPTCEDVDECQSDESCHRKANCTNSIGSYSCACVHGWKGDGHFCREIDCGGAGFLQFGSIQGNNFKLGGVVRYSCDYGYRLEGTNERSCLENDTWSGSMPTCVKVECPEPEDLLHASKRPRSGIWDYKSRITYSCHPGYYIIGEATRECGPDSRWTGEQPLCDRVSCDNPPIVANAIMIQDGGIKYGDKVHYVCELEYRSLGDAELKCNASRMWEAPKNNLPVCEHPTCNPPPSIINGQKAISKVGESTVTSAIYTYATEVQYTCNEGYNLVGESLLTCVEKEAWDKPVPRCDIVSCGPPPVVENAHQENNGELYGDLANYLCHPGYLLDGEAALTCLASGKWTDENQVNPLCNPRPCETPKSVPHSQQTLSEADGHVYKAVVHFECDLGYWASGNREINCNTDGKWGPDQNFKCDIAVCLAPGHPMHGSMSRLKPITGTVFQYNNTVAFSCDDGFYLSGSLHSRCTEHGTWSAPPPSCLPVACDLPATVANSTLEIIDGRYGAGTVFDGSISYECNTGYELTSGKAVRMCTEDASWNGVPPVCSRVECGAVPIISFATSIFKPYELEPAESNMFYLDQAIYFCDAGFYLGGEDTIQCNADRSFSATPTCEPVPCGDPPELQYATYRTEDRYGENVFQSAVSYRCEPDFQMAGSPEKTCDETGSWASEDPPTCEPITCGEPDPVSNAFQFVSFSEDDVAHPEIYKSGFYQPRSAAVTSCDKGYEILKELGRLRSATAASDVELARGITPKSIESLSSSNRDRINKILSKTLEERPLRSALVDEESAIVSNVIPKTLYIRQCSESIGWIKAAPKCQPMRCQIPLELENGHLKKAEDEIERILFQNGVQYVCDEGYKFANAESIDEVRVSICEWSDDLWNVYLTPPPACLPLPCRAPPEIAHGSFSGPHGKDFVFQDEATYSCDEGYEMNGAPTIQCLSSQTWSEKPPTCTPVKCPEPEAPTNGRFSGQIWIFQSIIFFKCDKGFDLHGSANLTCQADRMWSSTYPVCDPVPCGPPPEVQNSNILATSEVYGGCAIYTCKHGFYIQGYAKLKCTSAGTWQQHLPTCEFMLCPKPPVTSHVVFADSVLSEFFSDRDSGNYIYDDVVTYSCEEGYETDDVDDLSAICLTGENIPNIPTCEDIEYMTDVVAGFWSRPPPVCTAKDCGPPPLAHENGIFTGTETTFNNSVHYQCKRGYYTLDEDPIATCLSNAQWSRSDSPSCLPVPCGAPDTPQNGYFNGTVFTYKGVVSYGCDEGHDHVGAKTLRCLATGEWSDVTPICEPKDCGKLPMVANGKLEFEDTIFGEEAIYSCDSGYYIKGRSVFECMADGMWSHPSPPQCPPVDCGVLAKPVNGLVNASGHVYTDTAVFSCLSGYYLVGDPETECLADATWSTPTPACAPVDCEEPSALENAQLRLNGSTTFKSTKKYICDSGYEMFGTGVITCQADKSWSEAPVCTRVKCHSPARPTNGVISQGGSAEYKYQDEIEYSCSQGYFTEDDTISSCTARRTWSNSPPLCQPVDCGELPIIINGRKFEEKTTFMSVAHYSCLPGHYIVGTSSVECLHTGQWSSVPPVCEPVSCGHPPHLEHGSFVGDKDPEKWIYQATVKFLCGEGYHLHGDTGVECDEEGEWIYYSDGAYDEDAESYTDDYGDPECQLIRCPGPPHIDHGSFVNQEYAYGEVVTYTCDEGYEKPIRDGIVCKGENTSAQGSYVGEPPVCSAISCGTPRSIKNGSVGFFDILYQSIATYLCDEGHDMIGEQVSECLPNKHWSVIPKCIPKNCGLPELPQFVNISIPSTLFPTELTIICEIGYEFQGLDNTIECISDGTWQRSPFECTPVDCGSPAEIENGTLNSDGQVFKNIATYQCEPGYNLVPQGVLPANGIVTLKCQDDATWQHGLPECTPVECGSAPVVLNGYSDSIATVVYPQSVTYNCDYGYSFGWFDDTTIECTTSGRFSGSAPKCHAVSCGPPAPVKNAVSKTSAYTFQNQAIYTCKYGHAFHEGGTFETFISECNGEGLWRPMVPSEGCLQYQCGPPLILDNAEVPGFTRNTKFGDLFTYDCAEGHEAPENTLTVTCEKYGMWSIGPDCQPVDCGPRQCPTDATCEVSETIFTSNFTANCIEGYEFQSNVASYVVECQADATWSEPDGIENPELCVRLSCGPRPAVANSHILSDSSEEEAELFGSSFNYECDPGYDMKGSADSVTCLGDGTWGPGLPPTCEPKDCGEPPRCIENANCTFESTTFKSYFTVSCNEGYELEYDVPVKNLRCTDSGEWEQPESVMFACLNMECGAPPVIKHGRLGRSKENGRNPTYMEKIGYECDVGHHVEGVLEVTCQSDRTYSEVPECLPVSCGTPPELENGTVEITGETFQHKTTYICDTGYFMKGKSDWACSADGKWKSEVGNEMEALPRGRMAVSRDYTTFELQVMFSEASGAHDPEEGSGPQGLEKEPKVDRTDNTIGRTKRDISAVLETGSGEETILEKSLVSPALFRAAAAMNVPPPPPVLDQDLRPTCLPVRCGIPPKVAHTEESFNSAFVFKESVTYRCKPGFELVGEPTLHCQSNARFGPSLPPTCVRIQCDLPESSPYCEITGPKQFKFEDVMVYRPLRGYEFSPSILAPLNITCMEDGRRDIARLPNCVPVSCGAPSVPLNGALQADGHTYQQIARYGCDKGYELDGHAEITCLSTKEWSAEAPECRPVSCGLPSFLTHGSMDISSVTFDPFTYGQSVKYTCDKGYMFDSEEAGKEVSIGCQYNRKWDSTPPECVPVPCPAVSEVSNGEYNITDEEPVFRTQVRYRCAIGHEMEGEPILFCQATGLWSSDPPVCNPVSCDSPPRVPYSNQTYDEEQLVYGESITYECLPGYELDGASTLTCTEDTFFDFPSPVCAPIECSPPPDLLFGYFLKNAGGFLFMSSVTYRCSEGYKMTSEADERQYKSVRCEAEGDWSSGSPTCEIVSCGDPDPLENGYVDYTSTTYRAAIAYSCQPGYEIIKNSSNFEHCLETYVCMTCQANGIWGSGNSEIAPASPVCSPVSCGEPPSLDHGSSVTDTMLYRGITNYTCDIGYQFDGGDETQHEQGVHSIECWYNAQWGTLPLPDCVRVECPNPPAVDHAEVLVLEKNVDSEMFIYEDVIEYACDSGYELSVTGNITCTADRLWDSELPSCNPVDCGSPPVGQHTHVDVNGSLETTFQAVVRYECDGGYEDGAEEDENELVCTAEGLWSKAEPTPCIPVDCGPPPIVIHGSLLLTSMLTTYQSEVEYECDVGHELHGDDTLSCNPDKLWKPSAPECVPVSCSVPPNIDHGFPDLESEPFSESRSTEHDPGAPEKRDISSTSGYVYQDRALYECEIGFKIGIGSTSARCDENGKWTDLPTCTLVTCESLSPSENSQRLGDDTMYNSVITYACDDGYTLTENITSLECVCGADGRLASALEEFDDFCEYKLPKCGRVSCGPPTFVTNGVATNAKAEYVYEEEVTYTCVEGYELVGEATLSCKSNRRYSHPPPHCERISCGTPPSISNAVALVSQGTKFEDSVTYECHPGYVLMSQSNQRVCQSDGQWSDDCVHCDPVNCTDFETPEDGNILAPYNLTFGSVVVFACDNGHDLLGREVISCEANGQWSAAIPECFPIPCDPLPIVENGIPALERIIPRYKDVIKFTCVDGHEINGSAEVSCTDSGKWTSTPYCHAVECLDIPAVENAKFENVKTEAFTYGERVEYVCDPGYVLSSVESVKTCRADGNFSNDDVTCVQIPCSPPPSIEHGAPKAGQAVYGDWMAYKCDEGYEIFGSDVLFCGILGMWLGPPPSCDPISCGTAPSIKNGFIPSEKEDYVYGEMVHYKCDEGFELDSRSTAMCEANGSYSSNDIACVPITCVDIAFKLDPPGHNRTEEALDPVHDSHGSHLHWLVVYKSESMRYMSEAIVQCEKGFVLENEEDEARFRCQANKTWSGDFTNVRCLPIECPKLPVFSNGEVEIGHSAESVSSGVAHEVMKDDHRHVFGAKANYSCHEGYILQGATELTCTSEGRWSSLSPTCIPVSCGKPPVVENAAPIESSFVYGMIAEYQCIADHVLSGAKHRSCQANGEFSTEEIKCLPILCPPLLPTDRGIPRKNETRVGEKNSYRCDAGYDSYSEVTCLPSGEWSGRLDPCAPIECDLAPVVENAILVEDLEFVFGDAAEYSCQDGHILPDGPNTFSIDCQPDGTFPLPRSGCQPVECDLEFHFDNGRLHHPEGRNAVYGDVVTLVCDEGYGTDGMEDIICSETGDWETQGARCDIVQCGIAPKFRNAQAVLDAESVYLYDEIIKYTCNEGYTAANPPMVSTCLANGTFSNLNIELCTPISCEIPGEIVHGSISITTATYGEQLVVSCDDGYKIEGLEEHELVLTCESSGNWSEDLSFISCVPVTCDPLELLEHGTIMMDDAIFENPSERDGSLLFDSSIRYKCDIGYTLKGISKQSCMPDGSWTGSLPLCVPVECGTPPFILHGTIAGGEESTYGNEISYECDEGYVLDPPESIRRTCNEMGSWTGRHPLCLVMSCGPPPEVANGEIDSYAFTYDSVIGIICDDGYTMTVGNDTRFCQIDGAWSGEDPVCEEIVCGEHATVENGIVEPSDAYRINDQVQITCNAGFELFGDSIRVCKGDGVWDGIGPECIPNFGRSIGLKNLEDNRVCGSPEINATKVKPIDGVDEKKFYKEGETLEYCCSPGYTATTDMTLKCKGGRWTGELNCIPQCRHKCRHGGRCAGNDRCRCSHGWAGSRCHKPVCTSPCLNGGFCAGPFLCSCKDGWTGARCQTPVCSKTCQNGGRCIGPDECYCSYGYGGVDCSDAPFFSIW